MTEKSKPPRLRDELLDLAALLVARKHARLQRASEINADESIPSRVNHKPKSHEEEESLEETPCPQSNPKGGAKE